MENLKMEIKKRIEELREEVIKNDLLYSKGTPILTDSEYDNIYMELVELEQQNPEFFYKDSPSQKIYEVEVKGLKKVQHTQPMLSQEKAKTKNEIVKFVNRGSLKNIIVQNKLDGLTIVLTYDKGVLVKAVTRGNGTIGEDVTHVIMNTVNVPKKINFKNKIEVRAEGIIPDIEFERVNISGEYKSSRNLASGTVRNLRGITAKERGLKLIIFDLVVAEGKNFKSDIEQLEFLKSLNFEVVDYKVFDCNSDLGLTSLIDYIESYNLEIRPTLEYKIDGLVLKFDNLELREKLGNTSKYPKWGIAYKFESCDTTTKLLGVEWSVGKNGQITPNAILEPCEIDGVSIKRASLANYEDIKRRDLRIGDTVLVIRANDVIPKVVSAFTELRNGTEKEIEQVTVCPVCKTDIRKDVSLDGSEGVHLFCVNPNCSAQLVGKIQHYASRNALNIDGFGDKTVEQLIQRGLIKSLKDIYELENKIDDLGKIEKFGKKKIDNLLKGIEVSKSAPLSNFLYGLCIRYSGEGTSKKLAEYFGSIDKMISLATNKENMYLELLKIEDIGEATAISVSDFFSNIENVELIQQIQSKGVSMIQSVIEKTESVFTGATVVVTGTLKNYGRKDIKTKLESLGAKVSGSVSKKTNYVIYGEEAGSKYDKALSLGVPVITEEEFENMI